MEHLCLPSLIAARCFNTTGCLAWPSSSTHQSYPVTFPRLLLKKTSHSAEFFGSWLVS